MAKKKGQPMVNVLGQRVRKGSKKWERLTYQKKLFNQIPFNQR